MPASPAADPTVGIRKIPVWGYVVIVVVYLAIIQGLQIATQPDGADYGAFRTSHDLSVGLFPSLLAAIIFVYGVVAVLGWWRPVLVDHRPVQRWCGSSPGSWSWPSSPARTTPGSPTRAPGSR